MKYKKIVIGMVFTLLLILFINMPLTSSSAKLNLKARIKEPKEVKPKKEHELDKIGIHGELYLTKMGTLESNHDYNVINRLGYLGKYQFHKTTLERIGFNEIQIKNFIKSPELQETAMIKLTMYNNDYISKNKLNRYVNTKVGGVKITQEGMLAAAHLRGPYSVKRYLHTNGKVNLEDANGTTVKDYLREFENI